MTVLVFYNKDSLDEIKHYWRYLDTKESIVCILQDDIKNYCQQNMASHSSQYYEPTVCIIVYEQEIIPFCLIQDIIRSTNPENFPIVAGIVVQNLVPGLSLFKHLFQSIETNDELYELFFYLTNYFFETCIIPLLIPKPIQQSSSNPLSIISAFENIIKHYDKNIQVMKKMIYKQNKFSITIKKFSQSLSFQEIAAIKHIVSLFSKKMKFTYQMSEQLQKLALSASFFSYETVCSLFEQYANKIPHTKLQVKNIFNDIMNKLNTMQEVFV